VSVRAQQGEKRTQSIYLPTEMLDEIVAEAARLDRSVAWIVQRAWMFARRAVADIEDE
jgi:uncharacterized small protein (TIGR04563 family)